MPEFPEGFFTKPVSHNLCVGKHYVIMERSPAIILQTNALSIHDSYYCLGVEFDRKGPTAQALDRFNKLKHELAKGTETDNFMYEVDLNVIHWGPNTSREHAVILGPIPNDHSKIKRLAEWLRKEDLWERTHWLQALGN